MTQLVHEDITREVIGAAFSVHGALGPGFLESIYEEAMCHELSLRGLTFQRQVHIPVHYKNIEVGKHILDLVVCEKVVIELKAIVELAEIHRTIVLSYLKASQCSAGLLLNFGTPSLNFKRIVREQRTA